MSPSESVAVRVQGLPGPDQVLVLSRLAEGRGKGGRFSPSAIEGLMDEFGLPRPSKVWNLLRHLEERGLAARPKYGRGAWRLTPRGRSKSSEIVDAMSLAALVAEAKVEAAPAFASTAHPAFPPWLAPPELLVALREFLAEYAFDRNILGMTRFHDVQA